MWKMTRTHHPYQSEVQCDGDVVVLPAVTDRRALPPLVAAVDGVGDRVSTPDLWGPSLASPSITVVAVTDLGHEVHMLHQFTEIFGSVLTASRIGGDAGTLGQVQYVWEEALVLLRWKYSQC